MVGRLRSVTGRSVGLVDQVASGLSNVLAVVLVARALNADDFGQFAIAYATLTVTLTLSRSLLATRISLSPDADQAQTMTAQLVTGLLLVSPLLALAVFAVAAAATGGHGLAITLVVACATPVVCVQDLLRYGAVASDRPGRALLSDTVWLGVVAVPIALRLPLTPIQALGLWAGGAVAALLVALAASRSWPRRGVGLRALRVRDAMGESVALGTIVTAAASLLVLVIVAALLGPASAGSLRGAATAMGPVNVLLAFSALGLAPALVRRPRQLDLRFCLAAAAVLTTATAVWGGILLALPSSWGAAALGDSWPGIRSVLPWTVLEYIALCIAGAGALGLRVRRLSREVLRQRLVYGAVLLTGGAGWALAFRDVQGVAAMLALAGLVLATLAWGQLLRSRVDELPAAAAS